MEPWYLLVDNFFVRKSQSGFASGLEKPCIDFVASTPANGSAQVPAGYYAQNAVDGRRDSIWRIDSTGATAEFKFDFVFDTALNATTALGSWPSTISAIGVAGHTLFSALNRRFALYADDEATFAGATLVGDFVGPPTDGDMIFFLSSWFDSTKPYFRFLLDWSFGSPFDDVSIGELFIGTSVQLGTNPRTGITREPMAESDTFDMEIGIGVNQRGRRWEQISAEFLMSTSQFNEIRALFSGLSHRGLWMPALLHTHWHIGNLAYTTGASALFGGGGTNGLARAGAYFVYVSTDLEYEQVAAGTYFLRMSFRREIGTELIPEV